MNSERVYAVSLGCPKNRVDTEVMLGVLGASGYAVTSFIEEATVILINTCSFIRPAVAEALATIFACAPYKEGSCRLLVVAGCLPQRYGERLISLVPEVDVWLGVGAFRHLPAALARARQGEKVFVRGEDNPPEDLPRLVTTPPATAYLKIAEGCRYACSYCLIPRIRGPLRSRPPQAVLAEAEKLVAAGARELVLVAQDTGSYGQDLEGKPSLPALLRELAGLPLKWIRLLYVHPRSLTPSLLETIAAEPKVCKYLDVPFQHAHPAVLRRMRRRGSREEHLALVRQARETVPGLVLRTTLMVGFPGEGEEHFAELLAFVREAAFERLGVFLYSHEEGAPSFALRDDVPFAEKLRRRRRLRALQKSIARAANAALRGEVLEVLVEKELGPGVYAGRSYREAPEVDPKIIFHGAGLKPGDFTFVRITGYSSFDLTGVQVAPGVGETCKILDS